MKKIKILFLITLFSLIKVVNAAECENLNNVYATKDNFYHSSNIYLDYGGASMYTYSLYTLNEGSNEFVAYCRNAGQSATYPHYSNGSQLMSCKRTVFDPTQGSETVTEKAQLAYEKGIVYILQKGYKIGGTNKEDYVAANVALRAYEMLWTEFDSNDYSYDRNLNKAMEYYANLFLDNATIKGLISTIDKKLGSTSYTRKTKYSNASTKSLWSYNTANADNALTEKIKTKITNLAIEALKEAINYLDNGAASIVWNEKAKEKKEIKKVGNITEYKATHTYLFEIDKFDSNDSSVKMIFSCSNCDTYGIDYKLYVNDKEVRTLSEKDILKLNTIKNGSGTVTVKIEFEGDSRTYNEETINYTINLEYKDETISTEAYVMRDKDCYSCQNFYMLYAEDVEKESTIKGKLSFTVSNNEGCTAYIENADCEDENDNDIKISEGYKIEGNTCNNINKTNNENVVNCIINGEDPAGNSYQAVDLVSNSYCSVWCKEDYHFTLPGIKEANSGKYFSLKATVKGTKTCYMSKKMDYETFTDEKLEEQRKIIIEKFNEWSKYNAIVNASFQYVQQVGNTYRNGERYTTTCPVYETVDGKRVQTGTKSCQKCRYTTTSDCYTNEYKKYATYYTYNSYGTRTLNIFNETFGSAKGTSNSCGKGTCSITTYLEDYNSYDYEGKLETATTELNAAIQKYRNMINDYNSCSGLTVTKYYNNSLTNSENQLGWKMDYDYNPDITFWYEESYMNNAIKNELEADSNINKSNITETFYSSDNGKIPTNTTTEYDSSNYFLCYASGSGFTCGTKEIKVGKAKYVKQEMNVEGKYITPTQFYTIYPTGAIVVADKNKEDSIENSSELTNLLPVGLGTRQGIYNYVLRIKNLGEYYDDPGKYGRLWGADDSVVVTVMEEAENGENCSETGALTSSTIINNKLFKEGAYVCSYKVNCPDCPVECDPTCKNPDCPTNDCPVECENCVYTNNSTNIGYRPITPSDINPNDRELGVNWKYDENSISTGLELKAYATTKEIEESGETIYDINYEDNNSSEEFSMQVKLTASTINFIKNYNEQNVNKGGYANNTLKCYDHTGNDGITYDNIYCYSTFLDELIEETGGPNSSGGSDNVKIVGGTRYFDENDRKSKTSISGYWTTWSEATGRGWTITTTHGIDYYKKNYKEIGIGPSWK